MNQLIEAVEQEIRKAVTGKDDVVETLLMALLSEGHILLDDVPGVGKTTLAVAVSKTLGLEYRRVQFTPDVLPSDLVGFSMYDRERNQFRYIPGVVTQANLLLGDEINRTSSKTQSALLEAMEERQVTVDGNRYPLKRPFCVIATQNQVGTAGTQPLPHAQMDRFLVQLSLGYPDFEAQMEILRSRRLEDPIVQIQQAADEQTVLEMQAQVRQVHIHEELLAYITRLVMASREHPLLALGVSPRGALFVSRMARACAYVRGREYAIVEDVQNVLPAVCCHRILLNQKARMEHRSQADLIAELLTSVPVPNRLT